MREIVKMHKRHIYLNKKNREEAIKIILRQTDNYADWPEEGIEVTASLGRITSRAVYALCSSPNANVSAMDGVAVRSAETYNASETAPVQLKLGEQALFINTGQPIPEGFDAVIMIEEIHQPSPDTIEIISSVPPWHYVRPTGEDIVAGEQIIPSSHLIRPTDIGALLSGGLIKIFVKKRPVVSIIPTGDEIIEPGNTPSEGQVTESNSHVISGLLNEWGAEPLRLPIVRDIYKNLMQRAEEAIKHSDLLVIIAGSSAGTKDYTADVIASLGRVLVHGVSIMPGKPVILGIIDKRPVIGLPGYPVSAVIAFEIFARPIIGHMLNQTIPKDQTLEAEITRKIPSKLGQEEYIRVKMGKLGDKYYATPLSRGAGIITSLVRADGMITMPKQSEGIDEKSPVTVRLLKPKEEIESSLIFIGSHDPGLDLISDHLRRETRGISLSITHLGSLGGLIALKRAECHLTGIHLLDPETGIYNTPYIKSHIAGHKVYKVHMALREQGIIIKRGNPKNIKTLHDLLQGDIRFVNRQYGAGTRILLEHLLKGIHIDPQEIKDYRREVFTHMAVAALIKSGGADCGLGVLSAARALDLDFIPVAKEVYDLVIPEAYMRLQGIESILEILGSKTFRATLESMGGYDCKNSGETTCLAL